MNSPDLAFDLSVYESPEEPVTDLASLLMSEARRAPFDERIFPYLYYLKDGKLLTETGVDTRGWEDTNPEVGKFRLAASRIAQEGGSCWLIHVSPPLPGRWPEDRVTVVRIDSSERQTVLKCLSGPSGWSEAQRREIIKELFPQTQGPIRHQVWQGEEYTDLPPLPWGNLKGKWQRLWQKRRETESVAARVVAENWVFRNNPVSTGARIERQAARRLGVLLVADGSTGCGKLNSALVSPPGSNFDSQKPQNYFWVEMWRWFSKFVYSCGQCGADILRKIRIGYQCPYCQGVYQGC